MDPCGKADRPMPEASGNIIGLATVERRSLRIGERMAETAPSPASTWRRDAGCRLEDACPELVARRREADAMISPGTDAARKTGCSADHRRHLVGEWKIVNACQANAWRVTGDGRPRQALVSGPGLAEQPAQREVPTARIVRSVIEQGV